MSTRTALTVVGTVVGAYFGYPQLGFAIGSLVGSAVDPQQIQGPRIGEVNAQTSIEGAPRTIIYGTVPCFGNLIQAGPVVKVEVEEEGGGKGGPEVSSEHALQTYAIRICEGPVSAILRIWQDNKLVYDIRPGSAMIDESIKWAANKIFYYGGEDQLPDPTLVATVNADTPAYRGSCLMVAVLDDITPRKSISQFRYEVTKSSSDAWDMTWTDHGAVLGHVGYSMAEAGDGKKAITAYQQPLYESDDGQTWAAVPGTAPSGHVVLYSPLLDRTVAPCGNVNFAGSQRITYRDGAGGPWSTITPATDYPNQQNSVPFTGGCWAGSQFVIVSAGGPGAAGWATSPTGLAWTNSALGTDGYTDCAYSPTLNVVVGVRGTNVGYSGDNGNSWSNATFSGGTLSGVIWVDELDLFVAVGSSQAAWSSDGVSWHLGSWTGTAPTSMASLAWSPSRGEIVAPNAAPDGYFGVTEDGKNWHREDGAVAFQSFYPGPLKCIWSDDLQKYLYVCGTNVYESNNEPTSGEPAVLSDIVNDIHERCGAPAGSFDTSELIDLVDGLGLAGDYTGASAIDVLRPVYNFDKSLHDGKFWYPKRGAAVIETLTVDDLTEIPDTTRREQALDVPRKFHLRYQHAASGYAPVKASAPRTPSPDFLTTGEASFEVPVVLNEDQAAQCADKMYKVMLVEQAGTTEIYVPLDVGAKYAEANCIGLSLRGRTGRYRIEQQDFADWKIKLTLKPDRQSAVTSNLTGVPIPDPTPPPSTIVGATELAVMDIAGRIDSEDSLGITIAVDGALPPWYGARYRRSLDGGSSYTTVADITQASVIGVLLNEVTDASENVTDNTNVVRVQLYRATHSLESISQSAFMQEGGAFALEKADGSWEIMQARDWDDEGSQVFAGTVLHRGRLDSGTSSHSSGARFVRLDRPSFFAMQSAWLNTDVTHQAISLGETSDDTFNDTTQAYVGRSQTEWPVVHLALERDGSDVITATWAPRHRFGSDVAPVASVNFQGYRVSIDDGALPVVTFDVTTPTFTYDASALGDPVTVTIRPINRITGAGPATSGSV